MFVATSLLILLMNKAREAQARNGDHLLVWSANASAAIAPSAIDILTSSDRNYSNFVYPTANNVGFATEVDVFLLVKNFGSVTEQTSSFDAELYLTFSWLDQRVKFNDRETIGDQKIQESSYLQLITLNDQNKLWTPPVFFSNAKSATHPDVLQDNSAIFVLPSGTVIMRTRVMVSPSCFMDLRNYPFDKQSCPLEISLFGYYDTQVKLKWKIPDSIAEPLGLTDEAEPVEKSKGLAPIKFDLDHISYSQNCRATNWQAVCSKDSTCLVVYFIVERQYVFYLVDTFLPTCLIVVLGLISLWVDMDAVPARITLCVTTLLTLQSTTTNIRSKLPEVSYIKAIDVWLLGCQVTIFAVLLEFIVLHAHAVGATRCTLHLVGHVGGSHHFPKPKKTKQLKNESHETGDDHGKPPAYIDDGNTKDMYQDAMPAENTKYDEEIMTLASQQLEKTKRMERKIRSREIDRLFRFIFPVAFLVFAATFFIVYLLVRNRNPPVATSTNCKLDDDVPATNSSINAT